MSNTMSETAYLCVTCGTHYPPSAREPEHCPICEDDRQYLPPQGQQWTTLEAEQGKRRNIFTEITPGVTTIATEPKLGIGERAHLIETPHGNILWDLVAYLDDATIAAIQARGGVAAIAISHPHFY
ncbi:MAG: MBL fold metallo-hydrolase, partial [Ktedonobacterales bacterium]